MMQQQQMSQLMKQMQEMNNNNQDQSKEHLNIIFRVSGKGAEALPLTIQCLSTEKVGTLIQRYKTKSGDDINKKKFIYNAKALNPLHTVEKANLTNNAIIHVIDTRDLEGAK